MHRFVHWSERTCLLEWDLKKEYPETDIGDTDSAAEALLELYAEREDARFVFVLDEWDFIFHQSFISQTDKKEFLIFLRNLLKDRPYVLLAYMTGILPIAKYSSGSELNMFSEFTMASEEKFSEYFGFTEQEVDMLFERYREQETRPEKITRQGLKTWYDGYHTKSGERLYNPRSVVMSLSNNNLLIRQIFPLLPAAEKTTGNLPRTCPYSP